MDMTIRERFIILINNDQLKKADAIVLLEGDGTNRTSKAIELFKNGWGKRIIFSGGIKNLSYGSYPFEYHKQIFADNQIPEDNIIVEDKSLNTKEQAINVIKYAINNNFYRIILVASHYHQYRAYLTFLKVILDNKYKLELINAPASNITWFNELAWGTRYKLLETEFNKIEKFYSQGDIASFKQAIEYQEWKEKQP